MAFQWDNKNEELFHKLLKILGAQGKSIQAIRQAVKHILETSFKSGDAKLVEKQLLVFFDQIEKGDDEFKKLELKKKKSLE